MWQSPDPILNEYMSGQTNGGVFNPKNLSLFTYTANNPVNLVDPDGEAVETAWDIANLGIGVASLAYNVSEGNWGWAALDTLGLVYDGVATGVPFLPAGASAGLKASRAGNTVSDSAKIGTDVAKTMKEANKVAKNADTTANAATEGTRIHRATSDAVDSKLSDKANNYLPGSNRRDGLQPDLSWGDNGNSGIWADLTTPGQWSAHKRKYNNDFGEGIPMLYERGNGIVDTKKLQSGAGVFTGAQAGYDYLTNEGD
ncbi:polymorphic toxin type 10 domain-containing protein (plasmid) [Sulfurovum mangrovi]|nr:polymorphic toxin type 10 domain-containing protein [Sulfurovum mangrovi]UFH60640.1 polymorphic toxin type 10 domain-containing protein [Sulfurovum mangrovi]